MKEFKPKLFSVMKNYSGSQLVKDIISGIIVAIIALPLSIALAIASGVGPEAGIYTAIVAGFIVSFLGGSRVQIAGPTAAFATILFPTNSTIVRKISSVGSPKRSIAKRIGANVPCVNLCRMAISMSVPTISCVHYKIRVLCPLKISSMLWMSSVSLMNKSLSIGRLSKKSTTSGGSICLLRSLRQS